VVQRKGYWFLAASTVLAIALAIFAASTSFLLSLGVLILVGLAATASTTLANTLLQEEVADRVRGRVMGFYMAATQGMTPLGALPGGLLAEVFGGPFAVGLGAGCLLLLLLTLTLRTNAVRRLN
jgi:MFS family permease